MAVALATKVKPLADRLLLKPSEREEVSKGGIVLPDTAKEKPQQGLVIAVGPGRLTEEGKRLPVDVKEGSQVLFGKYVGTEVTLDGEDHLIVSERDVLAVVED